MEETDAAAAESAAAAAMPAPPLPPELRIAREEIKRLKAMLVESKTENFMLKRKNENLKREAKDLKRDLKDFVRRDIEHDMKRQRVAE